MLKLFYISLFLFFISSCAMIPELDEPEAPIPQQLPKTKSPNAFSQKQSKNLSWKEFYKSEELKTLIKMALEHNRDLKQSALRVKALKEQYGIERSELLPNIGLNGSYREQKIPPNALGSFGGGSANLPVSGGNDGFIQEQYNVNLAVTAFELDLFGRLTSLKEAALEEYLASKQAKESFKIFLISEVVSTYFKLLADRKLKEVADLTVRSQEKSLKVINGRFQTGVASELDLRQAQGLLESARAQSVSFQRAILLDQNSLRVLVGKNIDFKKLAQDFDDASQEMQSLPVALDSSVLLKRPDIKEAERKLKASNARIGAARAAFFPSISLTTSVGKLSSESSNLFDGDSDTWLFAPSINIPIFTWGRNEANLKLSELRKEESIVVYEKAIQVAFKETSDALVSNELLFNILEIQQRALNASERAYKISHARYKAGVVNYLVELDSLRSFYETQKNFINQKLTYLSNLSLLYQVLGGGVE